MAYAALVSLTNTINQALNSNLYSISPEEKQQITPLLEYVTPFQDFLDNFPDKFNCLEGRMRDLANAAEDILEYLVLEKVYPTPDEDHPSEKHELAQLQNVIKEIDLIDKEVKGIEDTSRYKSIQRGAHSSSSTSTAPLTHKDAMVGLEEYVLDLKDRICGEPSKKLYVIPICGMGGIGKITLARSVYDDQLIMEKFEIRVWVTISQDYSAERILSNILECLKEFIKDEKKKINDDVLVHQILMGRRYLVVMDDMWSTEAWYIVRGVLPDNGNGSRVMLTTRLYGVASYPDPSCKLYELGLLDADQSWNLLKQKVFTDEDCPRELESIGKEIAGRCKGLPLAIVVIAGLLSTARQDRASWKNIAENVKLADTVEHGEIGDILSLSYVHLPQYLRPCFLYMGSFPEDHEIQAQKLIKLWVAEGFVRYPIDSESFEKVGEECLEDLVKRNLVLITKRKRNGRVKSCCLHDLMRDFCIRKAHESKFYLSKFTFNVAYRYFEEINFTERIKNQRRVSINSSYLSYLSRCDCSTIHSIKCSTYRLVNLECLKRVRLLRVFDAEVIDVECSPFLAQLYELFRLRYLDIRFSHGIPITLSKLQNLQTLIIRERTKYDFGKACDIWLSWGMPQLRHVYFYGTIHFHDPNEVACSLESLQTLPYVSHWSCRERVLKMIPNLKKLKIDCSGRVHSGAPACLDDLGHLHRLENLEIYAGRCLRSRPKYYRFTFPSMLKKLTLKALKFPWNDIVVVGSLPNLQVLKLKGCTCDGGTWETREGAFPELEVLLVEDSRFEHWITESIHFPRLKRLLLYSCSFLNEIPNDIGEIPPLELIEIKGYAKKSLVESAELIGEEQEDMGNNTLHVICIALKSSSSGSFYSDKYFEDEGYDDQNL